MNSREEKRRWKRLRTSSSHSKQRLFDERAPQREYWRRKNWYYYEQLDSLLSFLIPKGKRVLELGCGTGESLAALEPAEGTGLDLSEPMLEIARQNRPAAEYPHLRFVHGDAESLKLEEQFDYVLLSDLIGELTDVWATFRGLRRVCHAESKIVVTYFNALWEPLLTLGEKAGWKMPQDLQNWLNLDDIQNLLELNGFEIIRKGRQLLFPRYIPWLAPVLNRYVAPLPLLNRMCLTVYLVARPRPAPKPLAVDPSVTVVIPCRNERGNVRNAVERIPPLGRHTEILFVDGNSSDGTVEEIETLIDEYDGRKDIKLIHQVPPGSEDGAGHQRMLKLGKGDAVRKGFAAASGEVLMILDADLTVSPEELPMFYLGLVEDCGRFVNGTRLVYPMEKEAMRTLNKAANRLFSAFFSWLLSQRIKDTLCGTKVLYKSDYEEIARNRAYFGDFDPFGDFDLLFGAAKQNLKIVEVPVHYKERTYGDIKIERFKHGWLLLRMGLFAMLRLKFR